MSIASSSYYLPQHRYRPAPNPSPAQPEPATIKQFNNNGKNIILSTNSRPIIGSQSGADNIDIAQTSIFNDIIRVFGNRNQIQAQLSAGHDLFSLCGNKNTGTVDMGSGDDVTEIQGRNNKLSIDGGEGCDTVKLTGRSADWQRALNADGSITFFNVFSFTQLTLKNVENVQFANPY